jgi:transposase
MRSQAQSPTERIPASAWRRTPKVVRREVVALMAELAEVKARLAKAEEQLRRNSHNSSQPPSQDKAEQRQTSQDEPTKLKRKRGGQTGHAGRQRPLVPLEAVDDVVVHRPEHCAACGALLLGEDPQPRRHQITELPLVKARVTEHQLHTVTCLRCGAKNRAELPAEVAASQFGPNLVGVMALLMGCYRLSKRQVADLLANCFDIHIAASSVVNQQRLISQALAQPVEDLQHYVQQQSTCNVDETSWRQANQAKRCWLWVVVTSLVTVFHIAASRSGAIARQLLGEDYGGVVGTDRYSGYNWLAPGQRQVCWSHLLRDFQKILERGGQSYVIGYNLKLQAEYLLALWSRVRDGTLSHADFLAEFPAIQCHLRFWLTQGILCDCQSTAETCGHLLALDEALWRFVTCPGVEPTNNAAERALRHPVIWRRTSHGTQSEAGSQFVQHMLTVAETCRLQRRPVLAFVRSAVLAYRAGLSAPSLLPSSLDH